MKIWTPEEAYERMADACAHGEYCTAEVVERMRRHGVAPGYASGIAERLRRERYIDDRRFAYAFVRAKASLARWGRRKIVLALSSKHIPRETIDEALAEIDPDDYTAGLHTLLASKARQYGPDTLATYEGRTRLFRFAAARGFETDAIVAAIKAMLTAEKN